MQYLSCGHISIPLIYVKSVAWSRRARTTARTGGYLVAHGFVATELTAQCVFDEGLCAVSGRKLADDLAIFESLVTDRMDVPDVLYIGGYPVVPSLQFALTSCNITRIADASGSVALSADLAFASVRVSKEASRQRALQANDWGIDVPAVSLSVEGKTLELKDTYRLASLVRTPDSLSLICEISDDLSVADEQGFLSSLVENQAKVIAKFPDGDVTYWVVSASLDDNVLNVTGSILPDESQQETVVTYWDKPMSVILTDLCHRMGVECICKFVDFVVDYYQVTSSPWDAVKSAVNSCGILMSWDRNVLTFVNVPSDVMASYELEAETTPSDEGAQIYSGCIWSDGINRFTTGDMKGEVVQYISVFRSSSKEPCEQCLKLARYYQRTCVVICPVNSAIVQHSAVIVNSNGSKKNGLVENFEVDFVQGTARYEVGLC